MGARPWPSLSFAILLLACAGCRTPSKTHTTRDPSADLASRRTFALFAPATRPDLDAGTARAVVAAAERGARTALTNAGYTETSGDNADLVFYLHGKALAPVDVTQWGYQPALPTFGISSGEVSRTSNSRLFVEGYDNRSRRQVWMDWVTCTCKGVVPARIEGEICRILEGFPARVPINNVSRAELPSLQ
jgi:hypothetical protein